MSVVQRKAMLKSEGFFPHKKNAKGTTIIYSRKHPTAKFVRVVVDSGIDSKTGKVVGKVGVKLCFVNRQKSWREVTTEIFTTNTGLVKTIKAQEAAEKFVKSCKHCKAKKFTAKTGNTVCANACWTAWGGKKNANTKKAAKKKPAKNTQKKSATTQKKKSKTITPKHKRTYPLNKVVARSVNKKPQKKLQADILPGDLVTIEEILGEKVKENFTGKVLGIVASIGKDSVKVTWTANTTNIDEHMLPMWKCYYVNEGIVDYRFKVLSRKVDYVVV
jgi:hypothetical protein